MEPPDPHFPDGWVEELRTAVTDPDWREQHIGDEPGLAADVSALQLTLDGMPAPPATTVAAEAPATSVTGLVTLATCPRRFHWSEIDRLPRRPSPWLAAGTSVHRRIELHHRGVLSLGGPDAGSEPAGDWRDGSSSAEAGAFATFLSSRFATDDPLLVEAPLDIDIGGVRVRGRIDAVFETEPGGWEIVDYKSGRPVDDPARLVQLQAYAVAAVDGAVAGGKPDHVTATFAYLGGGEVVEDRHVADDAWLDRARADVESLAGRVGGDEFVATPSPACRSCDFSAFCPAGAEWISRHP